MGKCVICGKKIEGYGNNPAPVKDHGECCYDCDIKYVIPARVERYKKYRRELDIVDKFDDLYNRLVTSVNENIFDDGADYSDSRRNARYADQCRILDEVRKELSEIEVDGIDKKAIWLEAWKDMTDIHLPECRYNHAINYIDMMKEAIERRWKE